MRTNRSIPNVTVIPVLVYADMDAAVRWLCDAFGFAERLRIAGHRVQMTVPGGGAVVAVQADGADADERGGSTHSVMVRVEDVDAHHARAMTCGAEIAGPPTTHVYGERQYTAVDAGGHRWTFTQSVDDVDPASWGGVLAKESTSTD
jgi:uncharacterized glyoxalase superfamily protein PhnB